MIFNILAIPVVADIVGICWGIDFVYPLNGSPYDDMLAGFITIVIGGFSELLAIRGRIFWVPIWFVGFIIVGFQFYELWGWPGAVAGVGLFVSGVFLLLQLGKAAENKAWAAAPEKLTRAEEAWQQDKTEEMWQALAKAFFAPVQIPMTEEMRSHNIAVLNFLQQILHTLCLKNISQPCSS